MLVIGGRLRVLSTGARECYVNCSAAQGARLSGGSRPSQNLRDSRRPGALKLGESPPDLGGDQPEPVLTPDAEVGLALGPAQTDSSGHPRARALRRAPRGFARVRPDDRAYPRRGVLRPSEAPPLRRRGEGRRRFRSVGPGRRPRAGRTTMYSASRPRSRANGQSEKPRSTARPIGSYMLPKGTPSASASRFASSMM